MSYLVFLLEEPSAAEMLKGVLPRLLPAEITVKFIIFEGKQDLEKQLERRLKGWNQPNTAFLVMRDKDSGDCSIIKNRLIEKVMAAGKQDSTVVRIACSELESFYLGDLKAVEDGLHIANLAKKQSVKKFRMSDSLSNASEELIKLTNGKYQKVSGSREIGPHLKIDGSSRSRSFNVLLAGIDKMLGMVG
ncbi:MAG: DUF4276 family protein [Methylobacter sp.]